MLPDLTHRYLSNRHCTPQARHDVQDLTFDVADMEEKARGFTRDDYVLTYIYSVLRDTEFQKDPSYYIDCWEQRTENGQNSNTTKAKALEFFKMHFPVKLSFNLREKEEAALLFTKDEAMRRYIKLILNCPEFKRNPRAYIDELKERSEASHVGKEADVALSFLETHFPEEKCIIF